MAKNQFDMKSIKNTKKDIQKNAKEFNKTLVDFSEDMIKETVKTGEEWQKLMAKAVKNSEPLMKKQSDILVDTVKGMKAEAEYGVERFEKLTGFDFSEIRKSFEIKVPEAPKWIKDGFEYITDQTEEILTEVSKRGEDLVESVSDTAKAFAKDAEELKDKAEARVKEVIKDVEARITDLAPKASAAAKPAKKAAPKAKKSTAKKAATKKAPKATAKKTTETKKAAPAKKATAKTAAPKAAVKGDDLKVIEGIGPKLAELLVEAGYTSYALLAKAEVTDLQAVLDKAGSRYKMHNPTTWPLQASFARDGKFEALTSWQKNNNAQKA